MRVGLLGLGTVGAAVASRLIKEPDLISDRAGAEVALAAVAVRHPDRTRDLDLRGVTVTGDASALVADPGLDIIIELIGGAQPAQALIEGALANGRAVVTANKLVIARQGPGLEALALSRHRPLRYEAAVGGAMPVISLLRNSLLGDRIRSIDSIINGTTNFIIEQMSRDGLSLQAAVAAAQSLGLAEADPASDVDGEDAACKLGIMARLAFGTHVDPAGIDTVGIRDLEATDLAHAAELGYAVKLVAGGRRLQRGISLRVGPTLVPMGHPLASVQDAGNAVVVDGDLTGAVTMTGAGAGGEPTASAVIADVISAARALATGEDGNLPPRGESNLSLLDGEEAETAAYLRLEVAPDREALSTVALMLEDRGVPVEGMLDRPPGRGRRDPEVLCLTAPAPRAVLERALDSLDTMAIVRRVGACLDRLTEVR